MIKCNWCGKVIDRNNFGYFNDYIALSKEWGYHSPYDGEAHDLNLCVECYKSWINDFEIPPQVECGLTGVWAS